MTIPATECPTRGAVLTAIDTAIDAAVVDLELAIAAAAPLPPRIEAVLHELGRRAERLAGIDAAYRLLLDSQDELGGEDRSGGITLGVLAAVGLLDAERRRWINRYARLAIGVLDVWATDPAELLSTAEHDRLTWRPPYDDPKQTSVQGEDDDHSPSPYPWATDDECGEPPVPLPAALATHPDMALVRRAYAALADAEYAAEEFDELHIGPDGERHEGVAEYLIDTAIELEDAAAEWIDHLAELADAITYTLATRWQALTAMVNA